MDICVCVCAEQYEFSRLKIQQQLKIKPIYFFGDIIVNRTV